MSLLAALSRWLLFSGVTVALGHAALVAVAPAADASAPPAGASPAWRRLAAVALVAGIAGLLAVQLWALDMGWGEAAGLVRDSGWGRAWAQCAVACAVTAVALQLPRGEAATVAALMTSLAVATTMGGLGHPAADATWVTGARALDAAHVAAMGAWIGGLAITWGATRRGDSPEAARLAQWRSFSRTATVMAPVALLTGGGSALRLLVGVSPGAVLATDYGRLLALKGALALGVVALGGAHRRRVTRGEVPVARGVRVEIALAAAILAFTAVLVGLEPPYPPT